MLDIFGESAPARLTNLARCQVCTSIHDPTLSLAASLHACIMLDLPAYLRDEIFTPSHIVDRTNGRAES